MGETDFEGCILPEINLSGREIDGIGFHLINKVFEKIKAIFELIGVFAEWLLADATCKYGTDWKRPIYLWLGVVFFCTVLFWIGNGIVRVDESAASSFLESLYFSIVTITTKAGMLSVFSRF